MPRYADYHRTVIGYHGTRRQTAMEIIQGREDFTPSTNPGDWLGHGTYFWEYAPQQAFLWAEARKEKMGWEGETAVLGSMIRLGNCLDLLDPKNVEAIINFHWRFVRTRKAMGVKIRNNGHSEKYLNCDVFQYAYTALDLEYPQHPIDTCRAVFQPTDRSEEDKRLWRAAGINRKAHIQICVRNPACILGTWLVKPLGD